MCESCAAPSGARFLRRWGRLLDVALQRVELAGPECAVGLDPFGRFAHWCGVELAAADASVARVLHETGALEDAEMLGDGGARDAKGRGVIADGGFAGGEVREDGASRGVGKGGEREVEAVIGNHTVTIMAASSRVVNGERQRSLTYGGSFL